MHSVEQARPKHFGANNQPFDQQRNQACLLARAGHKCCLPWQGPIDCQLMYVTIDYVTMSVDCQWTVSGLLVDCQWNVIVVSRILSVMCWRWTVSGLSKMLVGCQWAVRNVKCGRSVNCQWFIVGCRWVVAGLSVGCQWVVGGLMVDCQWVVSGLFVGCQRCCRWVVSGLSVGCQWVVGGLSVGCRSGCR